ncbi:hypothetical protein [Ktedonobacter sp. SOSP1-52]|uniref:hypothetical protein n=1 Tax=Ktedonobacter sp. SOSP1-52 TaxID=2778366 RepID=UPI001916062A|nr:hypothetical protein [Ktedonobacter sp. SOSP1-52]
MGTQLSSLCELSAGRISMMARPRSGDWLIDARYCHARGRRSCTGLPAHTSGGR